MATAATTLNQKMLLLLRQILLLLWKNLLFRRRHCIVTVFEVILPCFLAVIIALVQFGMPPISNVIIPMSKYEAWSEQSSLSSANSLIRQCHSRRPCALAFTPNDARISGIMRKVQGTFNAAIGGRPSSSPINEFELEGFSSEKDIEVHIAEAELKAESDEQKYGSNIVVMIVFQKSLNILPPEIAYKIRFEADFQYGGPGNQANRPGPGRGRNYLFESRGFTGLQIAIDKAIIEDLTGIKPPTINSQAFPYPAYPKPKELNHIVPILPVFLMLGFVLIVPSIIRNIVSEKETGVKELMKIMGLPNWMHWLGWMINSLLTLSLTITIVTALLFTPFIPSHGGSLYYGSPTLFWFVLFLFSMAGTSFCFLVTAFFQRPLVAIIVGLVLWILTYFLPVNLLDRAGNYELLSLGEKMGAALLPNVALYWAIKIIVLFEEAAVGAGWTNIAKPVSPADNISVGHCCLMLILDTIIYTLLTIYFENIIPSEFGLRKPFYYPFQLSTWRGEPTSRRVAPEVTQTTDEDKPGFETEPTELRAGVVIHNLKKSFGRNKVAVNMIGTLKMYEGQITALLGHNGAGKTTTLSMLTGLFAPSSGTATVNGFDITTDMDNVRKSLGLCPQHNMLFDELTVEEHMIFFGRLKGLSSSQATKEMHFLLRKLNLMEKKETLTRAISGGQKRKLSLGIALIGETKVVILDEPTSGMDPEARRAIWDLLLGMRGQRTIVLTTHYMEEADVLGDRIAIMAEGQVKCCGSPLFLKKYYGAGYTLKMTVKDATVVGGILEVVQTSIPTAFVKDARNPSTTEVAITIPNESDTNTKFPQLFTTLSERQEQLGIQTVGISLATMDEIFIKVGEESGVGEDNRGMARNVTENEAATNGLSKRGRKTGLNLARQQFTGLLLKRMIYSLRKWTIVITQFLIPLGILIITILVSNILLSPTRAEPPSPVKIDLSATKNPVTLYRASASTQSLGDAYKKTVGNSARSVGRDLGTELLEIGKKDLVAYRENYIAAADFSDSSATAWFSTIPRYASPISVNLVSNAILKSIPGYNGPSIRVSDHPLPSRYANILLLDAAQPVPSFSRSIPLLFITMFPIGLALVVASYIVFPVEERLCKGKQLQLMTGASPVLYWGSSFLWDYFLMFILSCLMVFCLLIFQSYGAYTVAHGGWVFLLILMVYGFSAIPFSYLFSTLVGTAPGGFSLMTIIHTVTGLIMTLIVYSFEGVPVPEFVKTAEVFRVLGSFFPTFGATMAIARFTNIATTNSRCNILPEAATKTLCSPTANVGPGLLQCCPNCGQNCFKPQPYLKWSSEEPRRDFGPGSVGIQFKDLPDVPGIVRELLYLFLIGLLYIALLMIIESGLVQRIKALVIKPDPSIFREHQSLDEDVVLEKERVANMVREGRAGEDALVVDNLCRNYGSFLAVSGLSFGVHHGECFGLLGVNGAGKTTSFRMLTGDESISDGDIFGMNGALGKDRQKFLSLLGYCPQFDGLVGVLTGKEMLLLFCHLRGVEDAEGEAIKWLAKLGLLDSGNVQCRKYSGGMKRRLCAAIALVGDPPILLFDEPTSGVDPIARHQFWNVISSVRDLGQSVVLTSHSMEECEALCSRLGIMVNGQFQCLGGVEHLKHKYAQGFGLTLRLKKTSTDVGVGGGDAAILDSLYSEISTRFHPCFVKDVHQNIVEYQVKNNEITWGQVFTIMEELRGKYAEVIDDYSVSETTLEDVFLSFARKQYPERDTKVSLCKKLVTCQC